MKCNKCGQEIDVPGKFCPHCGASIDGNEEPVKKQKKAKKPIFKRWWFWAIIIVFFLGSCIGNSTSPADPTSNANTTVAAPKETTPVAATEKNISEAQETAVPETDASNDTASVGEKNALKQAKNYLAFSAFSYTGLIEQLEYEGYTNEEATYAVDNCGADWFEQAAKKAKDYLSYSAFSYSGLIEQLEFEGFTTEQATQAVDNCGADWFEQAVKKGKSYLEFSAFSRSGLIEQLEFEGFTPDQAAHGATENGL